MAYVYILQSSLKDKYYIGSTKRNVNDRLLEHNKGIVKSTKAYIPWKIAVIKNYNSYTEAKKAEMKLKKLKRKDYINKIIKNGYIRL